MKRFIALLCFLIGTLLAPLSGHADELEKVSIQLKWFHQFQFAGYYAAKEKGFYAEEGLDVSILERNPSINQVDDVVGGKAQYGVADAGLLLSRLNGKPVIVLAQIFQHSPLVYVTLKDSGIRTPFELAGKKIMTESQGNADAALNAMILKSLGSLSQVELTEHTYRNQDLVEGKVDAMLAYSTNEPFWFHEQGVQVNVIDPRDYGIDFYGDNLFTTDDELRNNPERAAKVVRATLKGWKYTLEHKDEIIDLILAKYNTQKRTRAHLEFEAQQTEHMVSPQFLEIGHIEPSRFQKIAGIYTQLALSDSFQVDEEFYLKRKEPQIALTPEEKAWLKDHPVLRIAPDPDLAPLESFDDEGQYRGLVADVMSFLSERIGVKFEPVQAENWQQAMDWITIKNVDMLPLMAIDDALKGAMSFSDVYLKFPDVILVPDTHKGSITLEDLKGKRVAVPAGWPAEFYLKEDYPEIELVLAEDTRGAIDKVLFGDVDAAVSYLPIIAHTLQAEAITNIRIAGRTIETPGAIAVRNDWPELISILNKGLASISPEEMASLRSKWIQLDVTDAPAPAGTSSPLLNLVALSVGLLVVFGLIVFFIGRSKKEKDISTYFGAPAFTAAVLAGLSVMVAVIAILNWVAISDSKKRTTELISTELRLVISSSIERLNTWISGRQAFLHQLGRDPQLVRITKSLLKIDRNRDALAHSIALADARGFFASNKQFGQAGFFIISPDNISIGSRRDTNLGDRNFITEVRPDLLERASRGSAVFIPPIRSDVKIGSGEADGTDEKPLTMFFAAPITDENGSVLAVLTERIIPSGALSKILHQGRVRTTGETYAFNSEAKMVSESRFVKNLGEIGLINPQSKDFAELELRDPGGNLTQGYKSKTGRDKQPFTHMVEQAFLVKGKEKDDQRKAGFTMDIEGYRDYRGVPVVGTWTWLPELELGLATEIDQEEAMANHTAFRFNLIVISIITTVLAVGATLFTLLLGQGAHRSLSKSRDELEERVVERTSEVVEKEQLLRSAIENISDGFVLYDSDDRLILCNEQYRQIYRNSSDLIVPGARYQDIIWQGAQRGDYHEAIGREEEWFAERMAQRSESTEAFELALSDDRWLRVYDKKIPNGMMLGVRIDITDIKRAELAVKESESILTTILDNMPAIVFLKDLAGRFIRVNKRYQEQYGPDRHAIAGKTLYDIYPNELAEKLTVYDQQTIDAGGFVDHEHTLVEDNSETILHSNMFPVLDDKGEMTAFGGVEIDITERKRAEVELILAKTKAEEATKIAEEATKAKATFLATMSHEIRTPMGGVIGMVDLLQQSKMTDDQRQMMDTVRASAHSLLTIINDILDFSKIEAGKLDLEEIPISVRDIVEGAGEALAVTARNKNIGLSVYIDPDIPDAIIGDQVRLRQILFNFGSNAIKFTEHGKVLIRADKVPSRANKKITVRFQVIDDGIGIPEEAQKNLFQAFSQVEASTTRRFGGTGLGLSICQRLTEMMNGEIGVESVPDEGSTFSATITFPVAKEHKIKSDGHDLEGLNVLLAIGDDDMRELLPRYLELWKASVSTTADIDKTKSMALDAIKVKKPFDIIILGSAWPLAKKIILVESLAAEKVLSSARYIIACGDRNKADRKELDNTVYLDTDPLRRASFIKSVAVAAGLASPDVDYDESELTLEIGKAPSVEDAEAMGQLVLLAEDNVTNQDVIRRQLTMLGYAVEIANDGKEALVLMQSRSFAILMTDCHMPNMDGFELTEAIRKSEQEKDRRFPIVAVTASVMKEEIDHCFASGMDDYLSKPLEMGKLKDMLRKWMPKVESQPAGKTAEKTSTKPAKKQAKASGDSNGPIDPSALKSVFGDDEETFKEILNDFVEPATSNVSEIEAALSDRSADGVARAAHKLKSSSRSVGANDLADLCQSLETSGNSEDWDEIDNTAPRLKGVIQEVTDYIKAL